MNKEPFYRLVKINELSKIEKNSLIQIVGSIENIGDEKSIVLNDGDSNISLKIKDDDVILALQEIIRVFGRWDGIKIEVEKVLKWKIPKEKLQFLCT